MPASPVRHWLTGFGATATSQLIEKSPRLRTGGYVIDFWGEGYTIAERMGLTDALNSAGYNVEEVRLVDRHGRKVGGFATEAFRRTTNDRFISVPRGDLAAMIYRCIEGHVETVFADSISGIEHHESSVHVTFQRGRPRPFDLVIGADGIHSPVRGLVFGPEVKREKNLGYMVAVFAADRYRPHDERVYVAYTTPGRMVARFAMRDDRTMFFFAFAEDLRSGPAPQDRGEINAALRQVFGEAGWECPHILQELEQADDVYFDRVSQITMDSWSRGRVALIGDAAGAVPLMAGEGAGLAMVAAYVLAGELSRAGADHREAFRRYEQFLHPLVETKQRSARVFASVFAPKTALGLWVRNHATKLLSIPQLADWMVRREFGDDIGLPDYAI